MYYCWYFLGILQISLKPTEPKTTDRSFLNFRKLLFYFHWLYLSNMYKIFDNKILNTKNIIIMGTNTTSKQKDNALLSILAGIYVTSLCYFPYRYGMDPWNDKHSYPQGEGVHFLKVNEQMIQNLRNDEGIKK